MKRKNISSKVIRNKTISLSLNSGAGHLAPSLSTVEILTVLFREFLKYDENNPTWEDRDRVVFSKGHGSYAYYTILNELEIIPDHEIENFFTDGSTLKGCVCKDERYMLEASTGSLGHGLPIAVGMAWSFKIQGNNNKVICIVGDGEMQEGSNFEALQFAFRHKLDNLLLIVDGNELQAMDLVRNVGLDNERLYNIMSQYTVKENSFNIDGHDEESLRQAYNNFFNNSTGNGYTLMFCNTLKGKGIDIAEGKNYYHYRVPTVDGYVHIEDVENE